MQHFSGGGHLLNVEIYEESVLNSSDVESKTSIKRASSPLESFITSLLVVIVRLIWSLSIGLIFFILGLICFLLLDIFSPQTSTGYKVLNQMYKWGSLGGLKGFRFRVNVDMGLEPDDFVIDVEKKRKDH